VQIYTLYSDGAIKRERREKESLKERASVRQRGNNKCPIVCGCAVIYVRCGWMREIMPSEMLHFINLFQRPLFSPTHTHTHTSVSPAIDIQTSALCSLLSNDAVSQELGLESGSLGPTHTHSHTHTNTYICVFIYSIYIYWESCISKKPPHNQQTLNYPVSFAPSDINNTCSWPARTATGY